MVYFKNRDNEVIGTGTQLPPNGDYVTLTKEEYEQEMETLKISALNERRAQLIEEQKTETDVLNLLLIQRELEDINAYFEGKE